MSLFEELQGLMIKYHFRPEKKLSQFFCINEALIYFLVNSAKLQKGDIVLEVGCGTGFLTRALCEKAKKIGANVIGVEYDQLMFDLLNTELSEYISAGTLKLIHGNFLEQDLEELKVNKIVSLPPYHISSDIITKVSLSKGLTRVILVMDKGFVQKLLAFEGLTEYVALTVFVNLNAKLEILEDTIEQQSFFPVPNCLSTVVQLDFGVKNNSKEFFGFLKELFRHKNKDLGRSLKQSFTFLSQKFGWKEKDFLEKISKLELATKKVYLLSPQEFFEVFQKFNSDSKLIKQRKKKN
jgi:16S rRNA (adenine1518-N6/adenine1519-N6)-dimethyltransferase